MRIPFQSKKGFSLVELMIVIAIIGILSVIIVPSYKRFRAKTRDATRIYRMGQIRRMLVAHYSAEGKWPTNPRPGSACTWEPTFPVPFYSPDCLKDLIGEIADHDLYDPVGNFPSRSFDGYPHAIMYYGYWNHAVLMVVLEVPQGNPCPEPPGASWCDATNPNHANQYCICATPNQ